jgi:hypothetical protein
MGLWISLACLVACAGLSALALKDRNALPEIVPPGNPDPMV